LAHLKGKVFQVEGRGNHIMTLLPISRASSALGRWDPLREFDDLQERMNQLMASVFGPGGREILPWTPAADVTETEDAYMVEVDVPGVKQEDIDAEVMGNELVITGEYKERERPGMRRSRMRRLGRFEFRTTLSGDVDADNISAELAEGVLTLRVPKSEAARPHRISIEAH
jgi:HSP20 family protein